MKLAAAVFLGLATAAAPDKPALDMTSFFAGKSHADNIIKIAMQRPHKLIVDTIGGRNKEGDFVLIDTVQEEGKPDRKRTWVMRQAGDNRYTGYLSDASGPVDVVASGDTATIRYTMKDGGLEDRPVDPDAGGRQDAVQPRRRKEAWNRRSPTSMGRSARSIKSIALTNSFAELLKLRGRMSRHRRIAQPVAAPLVDREAVLHQRAFRGILGRPDVQVHRVQPPMIDDRGDGLAIDRIQPPAGQREALVGELGHRRREIDRGR